MIDAWLGSEKKSLASFAVRDLLKSATKTVAPMTSGSSSAVISTASRKRMPEAAKSATFSGEAEEAEAKAARAGGGGTGEAARTSAAAVAAAARRAKECFGVDVVVAAGGCRVPFIAGVAE